MNRALAAIPMLVALGLAPAQAQLDRLVQLDGSTVEARLLGIDAQGRLQVSDPARPALTISDLRRIERPTKIEPPSRPAAIVYQAGGAALLARGVTIKGQVCGVEWNHGGVAPLPAASVRAVLLRAPEPWHLKARPDAGFRAALAPEAAAGAGAALDRLFVETDQGLQGIDGLLEELGEETALVTWQGQRRTLARSRLYGAVLAPTGRGVDLTGQCLVTLNDGSTLWARLAGLEDDELRLDTGQAVVKVPWYAVVRLEVRSARLVFLSDLDPIQVVEQYELTSGWRWKRDRAVTGRSLALAGQTFEKGLGVHARCALGYRLEGKYDWFAATIGLQPPKPGQGDCEFVVLGDGKELYRQRVRGTDAPQVLRLPVSALKRLDLIVEPGEDYELADHANWADARLIRDVR